MRVVGGEFRGRSLATPQGDAIRPTTDRVRESLFNILAHADGVELQNARVLDLFAGTGALGIEALSRGAAFCLFVDEHAEARGTIRENVEALGLTGITKIFRRDATDLGPSGKYANFTLAFLDPPYGKGLGEKALVSAADNGWLADGAIIILEERKDVTTAIPARFAELDRRTWGDTQMLFATYRPNG